MPSLSEVYLDHALGPLVEQRTRQGWGVGLPRTALGANWAREDTIPPSTAEVGDTLNHVTWADDLVLNLGRHGHPDGC